MFNLQRYKKSANINGDIKSHVVIMLAEICASKKMCIFA